MDLKQIIAAASKMFPSADLQNAVQKAEQAISGTADTLEGVQSTARRLGIDPNIANSLYARYGRTMQAKALCGLLGPHRRLCAPMPTRSLAAHRTAPRPRRKGNRAVPPNSPG